MANLGGRGVEEGEGRRGEVKEGGKKLGLGPGLNQIPRQCRGALVIAPRLY